jgi:GTPase SAR1 family protein
VVGSQSSGKSSLLESITGFSFPRGQGLCTRYATQITLRRNPVTSTVISIIPHSDSGQDRKDELRGFHQELTDFDGKTLAGVINKASGDLLTLFVAM